MNWSSILDPTRALPLAFALIAIYALAGLGAARSFAQLAPVSRDSAAASRVAGQFVAER